MVSVQQLGRLNSRLAQVGVACLALTCLTAWTREGHRGGERIQFLSCTPVGKMAIRLCSHRMDAHSHSFFAANLSVAVGVIFRTLAESFLLPIVCKAFVQLDAATSVVTGCHFGALLASIFASKL